MGIKIRDVDKILRPDTALVIGDSGNSKTFYRKIIQDELKRGLIEDNCVDPVIGRTTKVSVGFCEKQLNDDHIEPHEFIDIMLKYGPRHVWRTIIFNIFSKNLVCLSSDNLKYTIPWLIDHPENVANELYMEDQNLENEGEYHIVLFDDLECIECACYGESEMNRIIKGLLENLLVFRGGYRRIRPKAFLRQEHLKDPITLSFPDSSKLLYQYSAEL